MWEEFFRRWFDLAFWWLPRSPEPEREAGEAPRPGEPTAPEQTRGAEPERTAGPEPEQTAGPEPEEAAREPAEPARQAAPDDLTTIKGIGPAMQDRLRGLGVATFRDLASADARDLASRLKPSQPMISRARVEEWIEAARERSEG